MIYYKKDDYFPKESLDLYASLWLALKKMTPASLALSFFFHRKKKDDSNLTCLYFCEN
jgi:hypothetical protein